MRLARFLTLFQIVSLRLYARHLSKMPSRYLGGILSYRNFPEMFLFCAPEDR